MAVINLIFFASTNDIQSLLTLLIVGLLTSFFSKNMIVILFISLVFTHILKYGTKINEGMENESEQVLDNSGNSIDIENQKTGKNVKENYSSEDKKNAPTIESLQNDFQDFQSLQEKILKGMKEIDPLLTKAESFIEKFERYKNKGEGDEDDE
jgi:hypothetical protein